MLFLVIGIALLAAGVVLLLCQLPTLSIIAFIVGIVLVLVSLFRRRRMTAGDAAVISSINTTNS